MLMRFGLAHIRGTNAQAVPDIQVQALAAILAHEPIEILLTGQGAAIVPAEAGRGRQLLQDGRTAAAALARRNVRSLLCRSTDVAEVVEALHVVLTAPPRDAEDALEDVGCELNLRYCVYANPDAALSLEDDGRRLMIASGQGEQVQIARRALRDEGAAWFCKDALARLVSMDIDEVLVERGAVAPLAMQLEPGAVMPPDTAHQHLHKGGWRAIRRADFIKDFCVACGRCFIHCPDNAVIHAMYDASAKETTGILGIDTDRCTACGLCSAVCPTNRDGYKAIVMVAAGAESTRQLHCVG